MEAMTTLPAAARVDMEMIILLVAPVVVMVVTTSNLAMEVVILRVCGNIIL